MTRLHASRLDAVAAALIGAALPLAVFGRALSQGVLAAALLAAIAAALLAKRPLVGARVRPALAAGAVVALAMLPSVLLSVDPGVSFSAWARTIAMGGAVTVLWTLLDSSREARLIAWRILVAGGACAFLYAVARIVGGTEHNYVSSLKPSASVAAVLVPLILGAGWILGGRWRPVALVAAAAAIALAVLTGSKSAVAGLAVAGLAFAALVTARRFGKGAAALLLAVAVAGGTALALKVPPPVVEGATHHFIMPGIIDAHRQVIWTFALEHFLQRPLVGWGLNAINLLPEGKAIIPGFMVEYLPSHPHNWLVEVLAETGILGAGALVAVIGWALLRLGRIYVRDRSANALIAVMALTVFWSAGAFNFSIWATWWDLTLFTAMALAVHRD